MLMLDPASILMLEVSRGLLLRFQTGNAGYNNDQILYEGLKPFIVPHYFFWSSIDNNYFVDISETWEQKGQMRAAHISQSGSNWQRYTGSVSDEEHQRSVERTKSRVLMRDGKPHEVFRHYSGAPDGAGS